MSTVVKTIVLSLVSRTGFQNATAPPTSSSGSTLAGTSITSSGDVHSNATTSASVNPALACIQSSEDWTSASQSWVSATQYYKTFTTTTEYDNTTFSTRKYTCTSSCGNSPGAISYCGPATQIISTTHVSTEYVTSTITNAPFPTPSPNCTIASSDCSPLITSWSSAVEEYRNRTTSMEFPSSPACTSCVSTACTFSYAGIDLYFFPVTKNVSRNMCTTEPAGGWQNSATITNDPDSTYTEVTTGASTVVNGITMYEGNIYVSITEPYVLDNCRQTVAPKFNKPRIITMASSDLFSVRGYPHNIIPYSIDYADFNDPVPFSAYVGQSYCANNRVACTEVIPGSYFPAMSMPGQIRQLDPNWANCEFDKYGLFDPPIALHSAPNFLTSSSAPAADPTPTSADPVVSATPGQSSNGNIPTATSAPQPAESASDPQNPASSASPQDPTASATNVPAEPQVSGSDPQSNTPNVPQDPPPTNTQNPAPNDPQNPSPSASAPNGFPNPAPGQSQGSSPIDPASPAPGNTQAPSPNDPQDPVTGQDPATNPNANPTATRNNGQGNPTPPAITVGPTVMPVDPSGGVIVDPGTTLSNGGPPVVISSSTFSIGTGGLTIVSPETSTEIPFGTEPITAPLGPSGAPVVFDPSASTIVLGGTTLTPGGAPITVGDTVLSVGPSGVVASGPSGTQTIAIPTADAAPAAVTVGTDAFSITSGAVVLAPGTTLAPGDPAVTMSGTVFSADPTGLVVVGDGKTSTIPVTLGPSSGPDATRSGANPSQTGNVEFPGAAARLGWSEALLAVAGVGLVMI